MTSISNTARRLLLTSTSAATSRSCLRANPNTSSSAVLRAAAFSSSSSSSSSKSATTRALLSQRLSRRQQINSNNAPLLLRDGNGKRWSSISATGSKIWTFEEVRSIQFPFNFVSLERWGQAGRLVSTIYHTVISLFFSHSPHVTNLGLLFVCLFVIPVAYGDYHG